MEEHGVETSWIPHFLDKRLTDGYEVVSLVRSPRFKFLDPLLTLYTNIVTNITQVRNTDLKREIILREAKVDAVYWMFDPLCNLKFLTLLSICITCKQCRMHILQTAYATWRHKGECFDEPCLNLSSSALRSYIIIVWRITCTVVWTSLFDTGGSFIYFGFQSRNLILVSSA